MSVHHGFFWLKGKPGAGKSTLMKAAFNHAQKTLPDDTIISFFFNARGHLLERTTEGMYRSLLHQLMDCLPRLQSVLDRRELSANIEHEWPTELLKDLFRQSVMGLEEDKLTCYIDALDECDEEEVRDMIEFFEELGELLLPDGIHFHVCFSSRHYPQISIQNFQELILEGQEGHQQDIADYVNSKLKVKGKLLGELKDTIQAKASGVFLWVVLVVRILNKDVDRGDTRLLRKSLHNIPEKLSNLFKDILDRGTTDNGLLVLTLQWIMFAMHPLKLEELYFGVLSGIDPDEATKVWDPDNISHEDMIGFMLDKSKGLAELTKGEQPTVQFIHESVLDYLRETNVGLIEPALGNNLIGRSHDELRRCCQAYLSADYVGRLHVRGSLPKANSQRGKELREQAGRNFPFLGYAVEFIIYHAEAAQQHEIEQRTFVKKFDHKTWATLSNILERHEIRRYRLEVTKIYIFVEKKLSSLLAIGLERVHCRPIIGGRYGTPLGAAVTLNYEYGAELLLEHGMDPDSRWNGGMTSTCLWRAVDHGSVDMARLLLAYGATWISDSRDAEDDTSHILDKVWRTDNQLQARTLCELGVLTLEDVIDNRSFHYARVSQTSRLVKLLVDRGADVNYQGGRFANVLQAASVACDFDTVRLLLDKGAHVNAQGGKFGNALQAACYGGNLETVRLLLDKGANVNAQGGQCGNALQAACSRGHSYVVQLLLRQGADVNAQDKKRGNPLQSASYRGDMDMVQLLLENGANVNAQGGEYGNALQAASCEGHIKIVQLLLERGAEINVVGGKYGSAERAAQARGHDDVHELLIVKGAVRS